LKHASAQFKKMGLLEKVKFFFAPLDKNSSVESLVTSVVTILRREMNKGRPILIFEDDLVFIPERVHYLDELLAYVQDKKTYKDWDILRLGYRRGRFIDNVHGNIYRGTGNGSEALVYSPDFAKAFAKTEFSQLKGLQQHIDHYIKEITGRALMPYEPVFLCGVMGSNIRWNIVGRDEIDAHQAAFFKNPMRDLKRSLELTHFLWELTQNMTLHERARYYKALDVRNDTHIGDEHRLNKLFLNKRLI
jgi:hypothetical protein